MSATAGPEPGPPRSLPPTSNFRRTFHSHPTLPTCLQVLHRSVQPLTGKHWRQCQNRCPRLAAPLHGQTGGGPGGQRPGLRTYPPPPSLPCPPFQRRDVRFRQVAHTCDILRLVTASCLCVIATQAHRVTPRQEESSLLCPAACIFFMVPVLPSTSQLEGRGTDSSI